VIRPGQAGNPDDRRAKRVLMVAYYFPPVAASGSMRPLSFVRHLPDNGWSPTVLSVEPGSIVPALPVDRGLGARVPRHVDVVRVGHPDPMDALVRMRDRLRGHGTMQTRNVTAAAAAPAGAPPLWKRTVEAVLEHACGVPDRQRPWLSRAARARLPHTPDVVYATGGPWTSLLAGEALARRFRVPFIADFRDPWTRNPSRSLSPASKRRAERLERLVCRRAAYVVANTRELREQFIADYPDLADKFVTITNGFDISSRFDTTSGFTAGEDVTEPSHAPAGRGPVEIAHFGTVYGERTPTGLLRALERLRAAGSVGPDKLRLRFVGEWEVENEECNRLARTLEAAGLLVREGPVPHTACLAQMRAAGVLLVLQSGFRLQIPTKIYEYVSMRRPLWLIGNDGATASLVTRHGLGLHTVDEVEAIAPVLRALAAGEALAPPQPLDVDRFDYAQLTRRLAHVFDAALAGPALQPSLSPI
jgi:glycosyltransferase involved in cell wall biosynthesis